MWVRSQDSKRLINVNGLFITNSNKNVEPIGVKTVYNIVGIINESSNLFKGYELGEYATEERVIQILESMQNKMIVEPEMMKLTGIINVPNLTFIYQMPTE
jgi:hypothetical protein